MPRLLCGLALVGGLCSVLLFPGPVTQPDIRGTAPRYAPSRISPLPNEAAIGARLWVPGLDDGFNPQGLTLAEGSLLVSGYQATGWRQHAGSCVVFRIAPDSGRETGRLDIPAPCRHAGGIAYDGAGTVYVSDTHTLFAFRLAEAFGPVSVIRSYPLGPGLVGALATAEPGALWIGTYETDRPGRLFRFETAMLHDLADGRELGPEMATRAIEIPDNAQGAAIDPDGRRLWISRSSLRWGTLDVRDLASGVLLRRYAAPPGVEGLSFAPDGVLWAVCEAGARHYFDNVVFRQFFPFNPLILGLNPRDLTGAAPR